MLWDTLGFSVDTGQAAAFEAVCSKAIDTSALNFLKAHAAASDSKFYLNPKNM